jgi:hypothetical protein
VAVVATADRCRHKGRIGQTSCLRASQNAALLAVLACQRRVDPPGKIVQASAV